jgi:Zn-finger protein
MKNVVIAVCLVAAGLGLVALGMSDSSSPVSKKVGETVSAPEPSESIVQKKRPVINPVDPGLPDGYWDAPAATDGTPPHNWSALESNLHPEACAQCHSDQFDVWKKSLHAHAYSSGLVGQFLGMGHAAGNDCLVCHAPLAEQFYPDSGSMLKSIQLSLQHGEGFNADAVLDPELNLPLRHSGVSCAACHVRGWQRFGPPPKETGAVGFQNAASHGGFTATKAFENSQFCASCHQFPQSAAINGKPLENTVFEWEQSDFSRRGVSCQQCHMPDRKHEFRGIHDPEMVRKGLEIKLSHQGKDAVLAMTSTWIGHAFPTYVTPKVIVFAEAENQAGEVLERWVWEIVREVEYSDGWQETQDTRLMPGETREFVASQMPEEAVSIRYKVTVIPDFFYKGVYKSLLAGNLTSIARKHLQKAVSHADRNDYLLYEEKLRLQP